jgi:hypothetical protein
LLKNSDAGALVNYTQIGLNFQFIGKISIDNKSRFGYRDGYGGRLIGVSISRPSGGESYESTVHLYYQHDFSY